MHDEEVDLSDIWDSLGFIGNPFSTDPIKVNGEGIPIKCFIGRDHERNKLITRFRSAGGSSGTMVVGETGVGKTSFVNFVLHLVEKKYFYAVVNVESNWTIKDFLINTFSAILDSLKKENNKLLSAKNLKKILKGTLTILVTNTLKSTPEEIKNAFSSDERDSKLGISETDLKKLIESIIKKISKDKKKTIIVYDDLDLLLKYGGVLKNAEEEIERFKEIFDDLRNTFQMYNVHFVFVGNQEVYNIIQTMKRVSPFVVRRIPLKEMNYSDIVRVIKTRLEKMKKPSKNPEQPYEDIVLETLYDIYRGDIKTILSKLDDYISSIVSDNKHKQLKNYDLINMLIDDAKEIFPVNAPPKAKQIVKIIAKNRNGKITTGNVAKKLTHTTASDVKKYIENHLSSCVYFERDAKNIYCTMDRALRWLILHNHFNI